jgi:branched-chain amino acid transport system substrate-binding protein
MTRGNGPPGLAKRGWDVIVTLDPRGTGKKGGFMKHRRWFKALGVVAVLSIVAGACASDNGGGGGGGGGGVDCATVEFGCVEVGADEAINLGAAQVISGADSTLGQDQVNALELALDHLDGTFDQKDGTLLDHPVKLTTEDELCSAEGGQTAGTALAADASIVAVVGTSCSSAALGVADKLLGDKGVLLISGSNTSPALTDPALHNPFYARTAHNDRIQGAIVAEFALGEDLGAKTAATIADESPYTQGLVGAFEANFEAGGGTLTGSEQVDSEDTDFKPPLRALAEQKPDILYFPIFVAACTLVIKQAAEIMPDTTLIVSDGCLSSDTLKNAGKAADGVWASSPDLSAFQTNEFYSGEFIPAYQAAFGSDPLSVFHAHAYDAANVVFDAIKKVAIDNGDGSLSIPRQALRDAVFATSGYKGVTGTITCLPTGDCATDVTIGMFLGPGWPVEGGKGDTTAKYTDTKSLDDVL